MQSSVTGTIDLKEVSVWMKTIRHLFLNSVGIYFIPCMIFGLIEVLDMTCYKSIKFTVATETVNALSFLSSQLHYSVRLDQHRLTWSEKREEIQ